MLVVIIDVNDDISFLSLSLSLSLSLTHTHTNTHILECYYKYKTASLCVILLLSLHCQLQEKFSVDMQLATFLPVCADVLCLTGTCIRFHA